MSTRSFRIVIPIMALLGGLLLLALGPRPAAAQDNAWRAQYWNNRTLAGDPRVTRNEDAINYDWGGGKPHELISDDNFSVRWVRNVDLSAGTYRFSATMDDGMRVWLDDQVLIDAWTDSQVRTLTADRVVSGGRHTLRVEYYEAGGVAVAKFSWQQIGATPAGVFTAWKGEYFNNMSLSGQPAFVRDDPAINFDWSTGAPAAGVAADRFSVRWTRTLNFATGNYRFDVFSDDGVRLWVNNQLLIDQWRDQSEGRFSANANLSGPTTIRLEYYENAGRAAVNLSWNPPGGSPITGGGTGGPTTGAWLGEYYNNVSFMGSPTVTRNDAAIDFNWGTGAPAPGIPADRFAVRWTRLANVTAGTYRFDVFSDDGVRLWVNNQLVIDQWRDQEAGNFSATVSLPSGAVPIRLEYYENTGRAAVALSTTPPLPAGQPAPNPTPGAPPPGVPSATQTGALYLNVRTGPSTQFEALTTLRRGTTVPLTGYRSPGGYWIEIRLPDGRTGWVSARYMTGNVPFDTLPVKPGV